MRNRIFSLIFVFSLSCASLAFLVAHSDRDESSSPGGLATLAAADKRPALNALGDPIRGGTWLSSLEPEQLFYGVIGICGLVLALRALVSALQIARENRALKMRSSLRESSMGGSAGALKEKDSSLRAAQPGAEINQATDSAQSAPGWWRKRRQLLSDRFLGRLAWYTHSLAGRMLVSFIAIIAAFGLLTIAIVYFTLTASLHRHVIERARITAINVSDNAPRYLLKKDERGLRALLRKHANRSDIAYVMVQNSAGKIFAHSFAVLPQEIQPLPRATAGALDDSRRRLRVRGEEVEELTAPISEGRAGMVRLGIWREEVAAEISRTVTPLIKILCLVVGCAILLVFYFVWRINRPVARLVKAAQLISDGDLEAPSFGTDDKSEFGELSRALERMRSSVKAALVRLHEEQ